MFPASRIAVPASLAILLALAGFPAPDARAASVSGLYEAEVPWEGDREAAFAEALGEVLVRMTGRRDAASAPELAPLLAAAPSYAQQFRNPAPDSLWVAFDGDALGRALTELGQPLWGDERPSTLVWLAADLGGGVRFVVPSEPESEEEARIRDRLESAAARRGVPLVFPLMDAEDRSRASFPEVWGGFDDAIAAASARYGTDTVLVGRLAAGDFDRGRWVLYADEASQRWVGGIEDSVDRLADAYAARYAVVTSGQPSIVTLVVEGIDSVEDYGRVSRFLETLTAVRALSVEQASADTLVFRASLRGDPGQLDQAVRLGGLLAPAGRNAGGTELAYRLER